MQNRLEKLFCFRQIASWDYFALGLLSYVSSPCCQGSPYWRIRAWYVSPAGIAWWRLEPGDPQIQWWPLQQQICQQMVQNLWWWPWQGQWQLGVKLLIGVVLWRNSFSVVTLAGYELVATLFQSMAKHLCLKISAAFARCDHHDDDSHQHHNHNNHDPHQHNNHHHDHQPLGVATPWAACRHTIANQSKRHHDPHQQRNHLEMVEFHKFKKIKSSHFENVRISEFQKNLR